jgi:choline-sulfatase
MSNIVLLMSDEHNPRYAEPYEHRLVQTPTMQRLADEGTRCENAYCASPLCMPSRSAFMAGRWVHEIQTYSNCNVAMEDLAYPSYGAVLAEQGIHTVHVGKTDVYRPGRELGFSETIYVGDRALPGDTNHRRRPLAIREGASGRAGHYGPRENPFGQDPTLIDAAVDWLTERASTLDRPWLLVVNINKPHFPQYVTQELWDMYAEAADLPAHGPDEPSAQHPYARDLRDHFETDQFSEEQIRGLRRGYLGCVTFVDRQLGRLLQALEESGQRETTNLIYTTDHGEMLGKFGMWWKCSLYEDSVRVPLIASGPDFAAGARMRTPVSLLDLQATLFDCLDAERPADWQGQSLRALPLEDDERILFAEYHGHGTRAGAYMVRQGDWKLIYYMDAPHQLFNLADDPAELHNVAPEQPERVAALEAALRQICSPEEEDRRAFRFQERQLAIIQETEAWQEG